MTQENLVSNLARMDSIHTRIKALREALNLSMEQVGHAVGVSWQTVQQWENGKTAPKRLRLEAVARALHTDPDHLLFGDRSSAHLNEIDDLESTPGLIAVRKVEFKISAGIAGFSVDFVDNGDGAPIFLPKSWADSKRIDPTKLYAARCSGHSMEPGMLDGDVVVVDTGNAKRERNVVFALNHGGEFTVKRLRYEHRRWWLISDNPSQSDYPPVECDGDTYIIGRIVHLYRDL